MFIESFVAPPRMIIFGAVDFTAAGASVAKLWLPSRVCDARCAGLRDGAALSNGRRGREHLVRRYLADVGAGLTERDVVCVLTHDHKFDVPAIVTR